MFNSDATSGIDDVDLGGIEKIEGNYNFEIPEIMHIVFQYSLAKDIILMSRVSKTWREVATSDLLWRGVMDKRMDYIPSNSNIAQMVFFYDLKKKKEDLYPNVLAKFQKAYKRKHRIVAKRKQEEFEEKVKGALWYVKFGTLLGCLCSWSAFCPPIGVIFQWLFAMWKIWEDDDIEDEYGIGMAAASCDACMACCCSTYLTLCCWCCCLGQCFTCIHGLIYNGKFFFLQDDPDAIYYTSLSVLCTVGCGGLGYYGVILGVLGVYLLLGADW